jgi:hemoglobin
MKQNTPLRGRVFLRQWAEKQSRLTGGGTHSREPVRFSPYEGRFPRLMGQRSQAKVSLRLQQQDIFMSHSLLSQIGGEETLRTLVGHFYDLVETHPDGRNLLRLHQNGHGLNHAREEQFNFLCGFLGGRRHYLEKHQHMNVKLMHEHVPVREEDAVQWLACMDRAMELTGLAPELADRLHAAFRNVAFALVNDLEE